MSALLKIENLVVKYPARGRKDSHTAVDEVSFDVRPGEVVGIVGESGSGKSSIGRAIVGLAPVTSGTLTLNNHRIKTKRAVDRKLLAKEIQVIFQDPMSSLNPTMSIEQILTEPLRTSGVSSRDAFKKVASLLDAVGLPSNSLDRRPREFSGGQRQRVAIARALSMEPQLIICDEPVSALDLTTQAKVLDLMLEIQERTGIAYLFISHDLSVVRYVSHRIAVMRSGKILEFGSNAAIQANPSHEYTKKLQLAALVADPVLQAERRALRHKMLNGDQIAR